MKKTLIFTILIVVSFTGYCQNPAIDSLKTLIKNTNSDTARINLKNNLVAKLNEVNLDSAIVYGQKVVREAEKIGYKKGKVQALRNISTSLLMKGDFNKAKQNLKGAKAIASTLRDSALIIEIYSNYGMMYGMQSQYDSASFYYQKAIAIGLRTGNLKGLGRNYGNLAISFQMQSNYSQALRYQQKSLKIAEEENNINSQAYTSLNMGITYQNMGDTLRSEKMLLHAVQLAKKKGIKNVEVYSYSNLASLYSRLKKWEKTYSYAIKAAELGKELGDTPIEAASYSKAATALANLNRFQEAEELINSAMGDAKASGQPIVIGQLNDAMGTTLMLQGKYKEAIPYYEKNKKIFEKSDQYDEDIGSYYYNLSQCYQETGAYEKALLNFKEYATIKDSIRSRENIQKATEQTMNYEFDKKEQASKLEQKNKDAITQSRQLALIIGLGLTLVLAFVAYRALHIKQKGNKKLQAQKEEVQKTLSKLKSTQSQLIQAEKMASLGELTAGIAHEIQNPLNFVNNFSEVSNELIIEMKGEMKNGNYADALEIAKDLKTNLEKINHHGKRADAIVKGMLQHSRSSQGKKEPTDINALCDEYLRLAYHGLRAKDKSFNATLQTNFDSSVGKIEIFPQDIGRVVLNLITNAFYAVNERKIAVEKDLLGFKNLTGLESYDPTVSVSTKKNKNHIKILVKDNGNGIPKNILEKIFQPFFTTKPAGQGTGLGLSLSYDIVKVHGGELKVKTEPGKGTDFIISIPIK